MGMLLAGLAGAATGLATLSAEQQRHQAELDKENRIDQRAKELYKTQRTDKAADRVTERADAVADELNSFNLSVSPERIGKKLAIKTQELEASQKWKMDHKVEDLDYMKAEAQAKDIDHTDYAGRSQDHELKALQIGEFKSPEAVAARLQILKDAAGDSHLSESEKLSAKAYLDHAEKQATEVQRLVIARASASDDASLKAIEDSIDVTRLSMNKSYASAQSIYSKGNIKKEGTTDAPVKIEPVAAASSVDSKMLAAKAPVAKTGMLAIDPYVIKDGVPSDAQQRNLDTKQWTTETTMVWGIPTTRIVPIKR